MEERSLPPAARRICAWPAAAAARASSVWLSDLGRLAPPTRLPMLLCEAECSERPGCSNPEEDDADDAEDTPTPTASFGSASERPPASLRPPISLRPPTPPASLSPISCLTSLSPPVPA